MRYGPVRISMADLLVAASHETYTAAPGGGAGNTGHGGPKDIRGPGPSAGSPMICGGRRHPPVLGGPAEKWTDPPLAHGFFALGAAVAGGPLTLLLPASKSRGISPLPKGSDVRPSHCPGNSVTARRCSPLPLPDNR